MPRKPAAGLSRLDMATRAGVALPTLRAHLAAGAPTPRGKSPAVVQRWLQAYNAWRLQNGKVPNQPAPQDTGAAHWQRERAKWLALRTQMEAEREAGKLIPVAEVEAYVAEVVGELRAQLEQCARRVPVLLAVDAVQSQRFEARLREEFDAISDAFAKRMQEAAAGADVRAGRSTEDVAPGSGAMG